MRIEINGQALAAEEVSGDNLEEMLNDLMDRHVGGNLINMVQVNGQDYSEDAPHAALEVERGQIESLALSTMNAEEIALHFIENSSVLADQLLAALPKIVEMFRLADEAEANEHYFGFLDSIHLLLAMLEKVQEVLDLDFAKQIGQYGSIDEVMGRFSKVMTELLRIQEDNDWVYLADIMEYELKDELTSLRNILPHLRDNLH